MSESTVAGGFAGDPTAALTVASGTTACCGDPAGLVLPEPTVAGRSEPCCGTAAQAQASGGCCGTAAKADAVASGSGCCE